MAKKKEVLSDVTVAVLMKHLSRYPKNWKVRQAGLAVRVIDMQAVGLRKPRRAA